MKKNFLNLLLGILAIVGINEINNCCFLIYGQPKENESLKKYKKHVN